MTRWSPFVRIGVRTGVGLLWLAGHSWCAAQALSFAQAAELARQNDPRLQMARQDLAVRRAQMEQAYGQLLPNASLSYSRFDGNRKTSGATSFPPTNFVSENTTLSVRQPLYRKALGAGYQKSKALLQSSEQELNKEEMELSLRTLQAYLEVLTVRQLIQANASQVAALTAQQDYVRQAQEKGFMRKTELLEAQSRLRSAEADQRALQGRLGLGWTALSRLTRQEMPTLWQLSALRVQEQVRRQLQTPADLHQWWTRAQEGSFQLKSLRAQEEAAKIEMDIASAGHLPSVDLVYQELSSGNELPNTPNNLYRTQQLGLQVTVPIYAGGAVNAAQRLAQAAYTKIQWQFTYANDQLQMEVQSSHNALLDAQTRLEHLTLDLQAKNESLRAVEQAFQAGLDTRLNVLQAQERLQQTRYGMLDQAGKYLQQWLKLEAASGQIDEKLVTSLSQWFEPM